MYDYKLSFNLNEKQSIASQEIVKSYLSKQNILLDAVCGAGKTEMLLEVIKIALNNGKKVGFACPRKQLLVDLYYRLTEYFSIVNAGLVTGNHKENLNSNFIFLTCHQLIKYQSYFDLLIIDEVDAFPFFDNCELEEAALQSSKQFIFLSATVPRKYYELVKKDKLTLISNHFRHHLQVMPIPKLIKVNYGLQFIYLLIYIKKYHSYPLIIYVPSIKVGKGLERKIRIFFKKITFVSGENLNDDIIKQFIERKIHLLISTTVLERGITFKKVNVIIYMCNNKIFDVNTLLQICGRVGRDSVYTGGNIIFLSTNKTIAMENCRRRIEEYNEMCNM